MMALSPTDRVALGLDPPSEFIPGPAALTPMEVAPPVTAANLRLALREGEKATAPKLRGLVNELLVGNLSNADWALKQLFSANPKAALELYLELAKFSLPQLKAVAVQVDDTSASPRAMSFAELQKLLAAE